MRRHNIIFITVVLIQLFTISIGNAQLCTDQFEYRSTKVLDNTMKKWKIPRMDRLPESDSATVIFKEGFTDSIVVLLNGNVILKARGKEDHSTGLSGVYIVIAKKDLIDQMLEIYLIERKQRSIIKISKTNFNWASIRIAERTHWYCDLRNYRVAIY